MKLQLNGIGRDKDCISALALYFNRPVTDYEMRFLQEIMNRTLEISLPTARTGSAGNARALGDESVGG